MPTPNLGLPPVVCVLIALLVPGRPPAPGSSCLLGRAAPTAWSGTAGPDRTPPATGSGLEAQGQVLVDVGLGDGRTGQRDGRGHLVLDEVAHAFALPDEPREVDRGGRHARRVRDRGLEHRVVGLDGV